MCFYCSDQAEKRAGPAKSFNRFTSPYCIQPSGTDQIATAFSAVLLSLYVFVLLFSFSRLPAWDVQRGEENQGVIGERG